MADRIRTYAYKILLRTELDSAWSNPLLREMNIRDERDSDFCRYLVKTAQEHLLTLDYNISLYLNKPIKRLSPKVLAILRLGAAQLLYCDSVPPSAAVNESVRLAKDQGCSFACGLINAVLRKISGNGLLLPDKHDDSYYSIKYSVSGSVYNTFRNSFGDSTEKILAGLTCGKPPELYIRKNTLIPDALSLDCSDTPIKDCLILKNKSSFTDTDDFIRGAFHVQDLSSQIACAVLAPDPGDTVADLCAAPGGKTATIAQLMNNTGSVLSFDIYDHKINIVNENLKRLGIRNVKTAVRDASDGYALPECDKILCDVPCSGLGVIRKKPEIRYKSSDEIDTLPDLQIKILEHTSEYLKHGGKLVYSTCTLNKRENSEVVYRFLDSHPDFSIVPVDESFRGLRENGMLTVLPADYDSDGFFIALLTKH